MAFFGIFPYMKPSVLALFALSDRQASQSALIMPVCGIIIPFHFSQRGISIRIQSKCLVCFYLHAESLLKILFRISITA